MCCCVELSQSRSFLLFPFPWKPASNIRTFSNRERKSRKPQINLCVRFHIVCMFPQAIKGRPVFSFCYRKWENTIRSVEQKIPCAPMESELTACPAVFLCCLLPGVSVHVLLKQNRHMALPLGVYYHIALYCLCFWWCSVQTNTAYCERRWSVLHSTFPMGFPTSQVQCSRRWYSPISNGFWYSLLITCSLILLHLLKCT